MKPLRIAALALLVVLAVPNHSAEPGSMTLEQLKSRIPFASWSGHVDAKALQESRRIYSDTLSALIQIGPNKPKDKYIPVLNRYIEEFNRIDEKYEFIMTIEREDICDQLRAILDVLKLPGISDCDDLPAVRDW
jgi:hypothetical protein